MSASEAVTRIGVLLLIVLSLAGCFGDAAPDPLAPAADSFDGRMSEPAG